MSFIENNKIQDFISSQDYISAKQNKGINLSTLSSIDLTYRQSTLEYNHEKSIHLLENIPDLKFTNELQELDEAAFVQDTVAAGEQEVDLDTITNDEETTKPDHIRFMWMDLNPGISRTNQVCSFCLSFIVGIILYLKSSIITYLLVADYGISQEDSGKVAGRLGLYACFAVIPAEGLLGTLMDIFGRRKMIGFGTVLVGISLILMTRFTQVYPALLLFYIMFAVANIPAYIAPLINDYLNPRSFGVNAAWSSLFSFLSQTIATSGTIKLQEVWTINKIFDFYGVFIIICGILFGLGLKDTIKQKSEDKKQSLAAVLKQGLSQLRQEKSILVSMIGCGAATMATIAIYQYGIVIYILQYGETDADQNYISNKLSRMLFITPLVTLPFSILSGILCDKIENIWRFVLFVCLAQITTLCMFYKASKNLETVDLVAGQRGSIIQDIGFCGTIFFVSMVYQFNGILFVKAIKKSSQSYGSLKAVFQIFSSLGVVCIDQWGGTLSLKSRPAPFLLCIGAFSLQGLLLIVLRLMNELRI